MKKLTATDPETKSPDLAAANLAALRALFPELLTEGKDGVAVNLDVLKQLVNNVLKNPFIWGMALTYFFIYVVRQVRVVCVCARRCCCARAAFFCVVRRRAAASMVFASVRASLVARKVVASVLRDSYSDTAHYLSLRTTTFPTHHTHTPNRA